MRGSQFSLPGQVGKHLYRCLLCTWKTIYRTQLDNPHCTHALYLNLFTIFFLQYCEGYSVVDAYELQTAGYQNIKLETKLRILKVSWHKGFIASKCMDFNT